MKTILVLCACLFVDLASPTEERTARLLPALEHTENRDELGQYTLKYVTAEGTIVMEKGRLVPTADGKDKVLIYEGEYTFVGDDGKTYTTKYKSDGTYGYQPDGTHLHKQEEPEPVTEE